MKHTHLGTYPRSRAEEPRASTASSTAQWVAIARSLGAVLPEELALVLDPYGVRLAHGGARVLAELLLRRPWLSRQLLTRAGPLTGFLLWMQLRTRALDDLLLDFVRQGGRQVVLLGAGLDCRALRFGAELASATVFEVDHPSTQAGKVKQLPAEVFFGSRAEEPRASTRTRVVYVGWDFEHDAMDQLPVRLHEQGLDPQQPVLTIWEGVTMYLLPESIERTVRAVRAFGAAQSLLALTYIDRRAIGSPRGEVRLTAELVARVGEPWRFGWSRKICPSGFRRAGSRWSPT